MRPLNYELIRTDILLPELAAKIAACKVMGLDIETASKDYRKDPEAPLDPHRGLIRLIQLNIDNTTYVVDMFKIKDHRAFTDALREFKGIFVGQNLGFEAKWLYKHYRVEVSRVFDTWRADCLIYNGKQEIKHDLYSIWKRHLDQDPQAADKQVIDWSGELTKADYDYAAEDVLYLLDLRDVLKKVLAENGLNEIALIEFNVVLPEALVTLNGFGFDKEAWLKLADKNKVDMLKYEGELLRELPSPTGQIGLFGYDMKFNLDSNQQLLASLRKLGIKERVKNEETGKVEILPLQSTGEMVLAGHVADYPIISKILDYRQKATYIKMFGPNYIEYINPITGRIHASAYPFTGAGRYAFSDPNLQQIPRDKAFRMCFRAGPGKKLIVADYSTIEMRVIAEITQDKELIKCFNSKDPLESDIHSVTAASLLNKKITEIEKKERQQAKAVNFGFSFGMQPDRFVQYAQTDYGVTFTKAQAKKFRELFMEKYVSVARWHKRAVRDGQRLQQTRTIAGRLRYLGPEAFNEYLNSPVQGCLQPHVRVLTDSGYQKIGDLYIHKKPGTRVWTGTEWSEFSVLNRGSCQLSTLTLSDGTQLDADTRHKVLVIGNNSYKWVDYKDLVVGDKIAKSMCSEVELKPVTPLEECEHGSRSTIVVDKPNIIDDEFWYWVGYYYGDGWKNSNKGNLWYVFGDHEQEKMKSCVKFWERWGVNPKTKSVTHTLHTKESTRWVVSIGSVDLCRWLTAIGVKDATAHTKRLPERVFGESLVNRKAFIRGVMDSDGHYGDPRDSGPSIHLCQRDLLSDIKLLLRTLGVESKLRGPYKYKDQVSWRLDIFHSMLDMSLNGFHEGPTPRMKMLAPVFLCEELVKMNGHRKQAHFTTESDYVMYNRMEHGKTVSVYTLKRMVDKYKLKLKSPIYAYSPLSKKEDSKLFADTFTLSVDNKMHRFDSEGIISKNTAADALKRSLRLVYERLKKYQGRAMIVHHVHDEITVECDDDNELIESVTLDLKAGMVEGMSPFIRSVPILVATGNGYTWAEK